MIFKENCCSAFDILSMIVKDLNIQVLIHIVFNSGRIKGLIISV